MILADIVKVKRKELKERKKLLPLSRLKIGLTKSNRNFAQAIRTPLSLIAEIKKMSPSEGIINKDFDFERIAQTYAHNNYVKAISVLTDHNFFGGDKTLLREVRRISTKPVLRKDFLIDEYHIYESRFYQADAILLIASLLSKEKLNKFIAIAKKYAMDCLVEVHTLDELKKVLRTNAEIIGINNRNLKNFHVDLRTTLKLVDSIPSGKIIVSESGFYTKKDINKVRDKVHALLIGTSLIKSPHVNTKINSLFGR